MIRSLSETAIVTEETKHTTSQYDSIGL